MASISNVTHLVYYFMLLENKLLSSIIGTENKLFKPIHHSQPWYQYSPFPNVT